MRLKQIKEKKNMQLNHFADPFQNGHASVESFFNESNRLTDQGGYDNNLGYGYAQNPSGYEWGPDDSGGFPSGHAKEYRGNGGYHGSVHPTCGGGPGSTCGGDPQALARANLQWERGAAAETFQNGGGQLTPEQVAAYQAQQGAAPEQPEYIYSGPDDLDYDDESVAPTSGMPYWKKRMPTLIINGIAVLVWIWLWSNMGFSKLLVGTPGYVVYWGFIGIMAWGVFQSDHRSALYSEERELMKSTESILKLITKMVAVIATILLSFEVMKKRPLPEQHAIYAALGIAFFTSLAGLISYSSKKRGEAVRRYRKIKSAMLNLAIGLIAVAALLSFGFGVSGKSMAGGGSPRLSADAMTVTEPVDTDSANKSTVKKIKLPAKNTNKYIIEVEDKAPAFEVRRTPAAQPQPYVDQSLTAMAPSIPSYQPQQAPTYNYYDQPRQAPTYNYYDQQPVQPAAMSTTVSPTIPQY
jgi:hypothetical protein